MLESYLILILAILFEVIGTIMLPMSHGFTRLVPSLFIISLYILSFYCLSLITNKIPLAILYSTWAGCGVFLVSLISYLYYGQKLNIESIIGLILIVLGVAVVNTYKITL